MKGLVLAAGEGSRLRPLTLVRPKHLIPLLGKPMIQYPIEDLLNAGIKDLGVVVGYYSDLIKETLNSKFSSNIKLTYINQEKRLGIAHAIYRAIEENFLDREFVVYLGDNILSHGISKHVEKFYDIKSDVYILLSRVKDPERFGVASLENGRIIKLVEKPREYVSDLAVIGVYFFRDPDLVMKAFRNLKPSWRGEYEITELIQWFIDNGYKVDYAIISGWWKDVGTYEGLLDAVFLLLDRVDHKIKSSDISGEVIGRVMVEESAIIEGKVYGPAFIGKGAYVGENAVVEHYVSVEEEARLLSGHITRSLVLNNAELNLNKLRITDSVIGPNSKITCTRELYGDVRFVVPDCSSVTL